MKQAAPSGLPSRLWIGAPAFVVLATCAGPQAIGAEDARWAERALCTPDLGWALRGGATCDAKHARKDIARRAAWVLQVLDRLAGAPAPQELAPPETEPWLQTVPLESPPAPHLSPARSNHQTSAP